MKDQMPQEYAWIKPGAVGVHVMLPKPVTFTSCPWIDVDNTNLWCADTEEFGPVKVRDFAQVEPPKETPSQTLAKARAVLAEHREGVVWAQNVKSYPSIENESALKCLVALADALEGGGDE